MIIDKDGSNKNKLGVFISSLALVTSMGISNTIAEENSHIDINYIHDDTAVGLRTIGYKMVAISDKEMNNYIVLSVDQLNYILETQKGQTIKINGLEFSRDEIESVNKAKLQSIDDENANRFSEILYAVGGAALFVIIIDSFKNKLKRR